MPVMILMTTVMVMMAITTVTIMTPLVLLSEGAREEYHQDPFSSDIHIHTQNMLHTSDTHMAMDLPMLL